MELTDYSQPTYNKLVHSAMTRSTVDEFVDCTDTPTTCSGEIFYVQNSEITHVPLTTPTRDSQSSQANTSHVQPVYQT